MTQLSPLDTWIDSAACTAFAELSNRSLISSSNSGFLRFDPRGEGQRGYAVSTRKILVKNDNRRSNKKQHPRGEEQVLLFLMQQKLLEKKASIHFFTATSSELQPELLGTWN